MVKCTGRGLVVKRSGVLSKVQMMNLVLGVGVFSPLPMNHIRGGGDFPVSRGLYRGALPSKNRTAFVPCRCRQILKLILGNYSDKHRQKN